MGRKVSYPAATVRSGSKAGTGLGRQEVNSARGTEPKRLAKDVCGIAALPPWVVFGWRRPARCSRPLRPWTTTLFRMPSLAFVMMGSWVRVTSSGTTTFTSKIRNFLLEERP